VTHRRHSPLHHIGRAVLVVVGAAWLAIAAGGAQAAGGSVPVLTATGVVDSVMAGYIEDGISRAEAANAPAIVIRLDTPGGALDATNRIVGAELDSTVPVIVWVAPAGGFAASAGTFVTLAANLAYMAPGTRIGAASPIDSNGNDIPGTLGQKVRNDAIASIRSIAQTRGRNVEWAASTVAQAVSSSATEAVVQHAVDGVAGTLDDVRAAAQGRAVTVGGGKTVTIDLAGTSFSEQPENAVLTILHLLADPNIAFVLFVLGALALAVEVTHPNVLSGIAGAILLILAFLGFGSLPLNVAGLLLVTLGIGLFGAELFITSHGLLTAGGIVAFVLGASALYTSPGTATGPDVSVAMPLIVVMTGTAAGLMTLVVISALRSRRLTASAGTVGTGVPVGTQGEVRRPLGPLGSVYVAGEEWSARSADDRPIERGVPVTVVGLDGLTVIVQPTDQPPAPSSSSTPGSPASPAPPVTPGPSTRPAS
jgi:membrane-bound serine protease (ClpP class)